MHFSHPKADELQQLAKQIGITLDDKEAGLFCELMTPFLKGYEFIDAAVDEHPGENYAGRNYKVPGRNENPLNAWYVTTSIKGAESGPLAGKRVAVKDNIFVANIPLMNGAEPLRGFTPDYDATVVTRLLDAGAEISGKAVCEYFCLSGASCASSTGPVENPRKAGYSSGGSSSGSAALVGAGTVEMALGCDQAGSIRAPASWSGICGLKPTFGLVPYSGIMGHEPRIDHVGPMTINVADNALMLETLAGYDDLDGRQRGLVLDKYTAALGREARGMKIALVKEGFAQPESEAVVDDCVQAAAAKFSAMGAQVDEVSIPWHTGGIAVWTGITGDGLWKTMQMGGVGFSFEGRYLPQQNIAIQKFLGQLDTAPVTAKLLSLLGKYLEKYNGYYYAKAANLSRQLGQAYDRVLSDYDLLLMPTTRYKARPNPEDFGSLSPQEMLAHTMVGIENTCPFDVTGHPAISIPCGLREDLPIGLMLIGKHFHEPAIYRAAHAFEQSANWQEM